MIEKQNNWDITLDIRKEMYKIMLNLDTKYTKSQYSKPEQEDIFIIKEFTRNGEFLTTKDLKINTKEIDKLSLNTTNKRFNKYLSLFKCSIDDIKDFPYYLIPCFLSLRFFLFKKLKSKKFVYNKNDQLYSHLVNYLPEDKSNNDEINIFNNDDDNDAENNIDNNYNNDNNDDSTVENNATTLYYYEFEALLASCIAALTFTYLHINSYPELEKRKIFHDNSNTSSSEYSIEANIKENNIGCHNLYDNLRYHQSRSLQLKKSWSIDQMEDIDQYENAIQIFSEYINILNTNTNAMQSLKLSIDFTEFKSFTSMYHYQWEESFHCMIHPIKVSEERNIASIFNKLFNVRHFNDHINNKDYINYLSNLYTKMLSTLVSNIK